jgi:YD repeat-containing protein
MTNRWTVQKNDTAYSYDQASRLTNINYPVSPDVSFGYDPAGRITNMVDGSGTTALAYMSFGSLFTEIQTLASQYGSSVLAVTNLYWTNHLRQAFTVSEANGTGSQYYWPQWFNYDNGNRLGSTSNSFGDFGYSYQGAGGLIQKIAYLGGSYVTNSYDSVARLLFTKLKKSDHSDLNPHSYLYDLAGQRTKQTRTDGSYVDYGYDNLGQLKSAAGKESGGSSRLNEQFSYGYDAAWNLQYRTNNALVQTFTANSRNELTGLSRNTSLTVAGNTSLSATNVTINGLAATRYADNTFAKDGFTLTNGVNAYTVIAQDSNGRCETNILSLDLPSSITLTNDANGNLTSDTLRTFDYDDENRLIRVTVANGWKSEFVYDVAHIRRDSNSAMSQTVGRANLSMTASVGGGCAWSICGSMELGR